MSDLEKYEKLRAYIEQQIADIQGNLDSIGMAEKLAKQMQLHFLFQIKDKMNQLDEED
ncbi:MULTISPECIES: hypothetical protein [unclassified Solibacillus]|uniref:hypothetical protein n=1 Tax=unclassified Solibacillus TaxID=2637870 RepID=UPI0030F5E5F3